MSPAIHSRPTNERSREVVLPGSSAALAAVTNTPPQCSLLGLGYYLPERILTNHQLAETVDTSDEWIVERTGIRGRRLADSGEATSDLAERAARAAIADAGLEPSDLDLILLATSTPDAPVPSTACYLQSRLAVGSKGIPSMDVAAGCSGFGYALHLASAAARSGVHKRILVVGADCLTRVTNYNDRQTCILFGDGAGAVVVAPPKTAKSHAEVLYSDIGADGSNTDLIRIQAGGSRQPACLESVADGGALHKLELRGREVFKVAVRQMVDCIRRAATAIGVQTSDFDLVVPHQANARIIEAVGQQLEVPADKLVIDIGETGNMASASIPVALGRARARGQLQGKRLVVVVGFGAGLTWACQVLSFTGE